MLNKPSDRFGSFDEAVVDDLRSVSLLTARSGHKN